MRVESRKSGRAIMGPQKIILIAQQGVTELMNSPLIVDDQDHRTMLVHAVCELWRMSQRPCLRHGQPSMQYSGRVGKVQQIAGRSTHWGYVTACIPLMEQPYHKFQI